MSHRAKRKVVVTDHSKIGVESKWMLCPTREIGALITDIGASDESLARFLELGIEVIRV